MNSEEPLPHYRRRDLQRYLRQEVPEAERSAIAQHLSVCARCAARAGIGYVAPREAGWWAPEAYGRDAEADAAVSHHVELRIPFRHRILAFFTLPRIVFASVTLVAGALGWLAWTYHQQYESAKNQLAQTEAQLAALRKSPPSPSDPLLASLNEGGHPANRYFSSHGGTAEAGRWLATARTLLTGKRVEPRADIQLALARTRAGNVERGAADQAHNQPVLLSPFATAVRTPRPTFRWTPVAGAQAYTVSVSQGQNAVWTSIEVNASEITLPSNVPELGSGQTYSWQVVADVLGEKKPSNRDSFLVLNAADQQTVAVREQEFGDSPILLAALYESYGLYDDAAVQIRRLAALNPNTPLPTELLTSLRNLRKL